jgi:hypothetical protein
MPSRALAILVLLLGLAWPGPGSDPMAQKKTAAAAAKEPTGPFGALDCLATNRGDPGAGFRCLHNRFAPLDGDIQCLRDTYAGFIERVEADGKSGRPVVVMKDGARIPWDDGVTDKTFDELLDRPDLGDQLSIPYRPGREYDPPALDDDPGRIRSEPFFKAVYGATAAEVRKNLVSVAWMPSLSGKKLKFNSLNGAAAALENVVADLEKLPKKFMKYVKTSAGTYNWRAIAGTKRLSVHSFGIAVDIDVKYSDYWRWVMKKDPSLPYRNRVPVEIAEVFERHGFVWGGKWYHFDTMHFEYRPELLHPLCVGQ